MIKGKRISRKNNYDSERGIALVEVVAALGVAVMVITALVSLSISTLRTSLNSKLLLEGSDIANREIELVRAYRDSSASWADFVGAVRGCTAPCSMNSNVSVNSNPTVEGTGSEALTRSFTATKVDGTPLSATDPIDQIVRISVSVTWKIGDQDKGAYIYTDLTNWREE